MRRHRRDAISLQAEAEWEAPPPPMATTTTQTPFSTGWSWTDHPVPPTTTVTLVPPPGDQLICPLASPLADLLSPFALPHVVDTSPLAPDQADAVNIDTDLQATLARFAFPSTTRKHRRSGESIDHHPAPPPSALGGGGATRRCGTGIAKRVQCAHCEHERTSSV
jgi:hypothetical protein